MASKNVIEVKSQQVDEIKAKIASAKSLVVIDYMGLTVAQDTAFRKELRTNGIEYAVLKNRLVQRAFHELGFKDFDAALNGPSAVAFSKTDALAPAKIIVSTIKAVGKMTAKCAMVEGSFVDADGISKLAAIPSREILLSRMLGSMQSPITGLAICLNKIAEQMEQKA